MSIRLLACLIFAAGVSGPVHAQQGPAISGGIVCGAPTKLRCNMISPNHDKFYKFVKGHEWTDSVMATDFCAAEKSMRVAAETRTASVPAGCCGAVVVQVTCGSAAPAVSRPAVSRPAVSRPAKAVRPAAARTAAVRAKPPKPQ